MPSATHNGPGAPGCESRTITTRERWETNSQGLQDPFREQGLGRGRLEPPWAHPPLPPSAGGDSRCPQWRGPVGTHPGAGRGARRPEVRARHPDTRPPERAAASSASPCCAGRAGLRGARGCGPPGPAGAATPGPGPAPGPAPPRPAARTKARRGGASALLAGVGGRVVRWQTAGDWGGGRRRAAGLVQPPRPAPDLAQQQSGAGRTEPGWKEPGRRWGGAFGWPRGTILHPRPRSVSKVACRRVGGALCPLEGFLLPYMREGTWYGEADLYRRLPQDLPSPRAKPKTAP